LPCLVSSLVFTRNSELSTRNFPVPLAAAILPHLLLRHPPPQQTRGVIAPNSPFLAFCRSCQVPFSPYGSQTLCAIAYVPHMEKSGIFSRFPFSPFSPNSTYRRKIYNDQRWIVNIAVGGKFSTPPLPQTCFIFSGNWRLETRNFSSAFSEYHFI
jgi:hypothetical protein